MANEYYWKIWLRPNLLATDTKEELFAEVLTEKEILKNEDIADRIIARGKLPVAYRHPVHAGIRVVEIAAFYRI